MELLAKWFENDLNGLNPMELTLCAKPRSTSYANWLRKCTNDVMDTLNVANKIENKECNIYF